MPSLTDNGPLQSRVRQQLDRILQSTHFRSAPRQSAFLRFVVEESLAGRGQDLKETLVATQVYEKPADYDPRVDSTVRVEATKLRQRLAAYYKGPGFADPLQFTIPKGGYHLQILDLESAPSSPPRRHRFLLPAAIGAAIAAVALILILVSPFKLAYPLPSVERMERLTPIGSYATDAAIAANSAFAVYSSDRDNNGVLNLWRHPLDGGLPSRLTHSPVNHRQASISPDAGEIVFRADSEGGQCFVMPSTGGEPRALPKTAGALNPRIGGVDGHKLLYWIPQDQETLDYGRVFLTSTLPGSFAPVPLFGDFAHASRPIWSSDGRYVLILGTWHSGVPDKEFDAWLLELDGFYPKGGPVKTGLFPLLQASGIYRGTNERARIQVSDWRQGWLYLSAPAGSSRHLYRVRLSPSGQIEGKPQPLNLTAGDVQELAFAARGNKFVLTQRESSTNLHSLPISPLPAPDDKPLRHTSETGINLRPALTPSGDTAVLERLLPSSIENEVWLFNLITGHRRRLEGNTPGVRSHALLSPDGLTVAYRLSDPGFQPVFAQPAAGGPERLICRNCGTPSDWTANGRHMLYITGGQPAKIGLLDTVTGEYHDWIRHPSYNLYGARANLTSSGDGWVAFYADNSTSTRQLFLSRIHGWKPSAPKDWIPLTDGAQWDQSPAWASGAHTLFYFNRHDGFLCIMSRRILPDATPDGPASVFRHFHTHSTSLTVSVPRRGGNALWASANRLYFLSEDRRSGIWVASAK